MLGAVVIVSSLAHIRRSNSNLLNMEMNCDVSMWNEQMSNGNPQKDYAHCFNAIRRLQSTVRPHTTYKYNHTQSHQNTYIYSIIPRVYFFTYSRYSRVWNFDFFRPVKHLILR